MMHMKTQNGARCAVRSRSCCVFIVCFLVFLSVFFGVYLFGNSLTFSYLCNVFETQMRAEDEGRKSKCV